MPMTYALECMQLSKRFGKVRALQHFNLQVNTGDMVALLGPSGCGKTTTLRLIAGFEEPTEGEIHVDGKLVASTRHFIEPEARRIGMVFQDYALFPHLSIADNIAFGLHGDKRQKQNRVSEMLRLTNLDDYAKRMPHELSGGQQQRVALARALAPEPAIVLLDEPFSNLDTALRAQVRADVRGILKAAGTTAIFVTHDQEEALSMADQVAIMIGGQMMQCAPPQELYRQPVNREVAAFVGESNFLRGEAAGNHVNCALGQLAIQQAMKGPVDLLIRPEDLDLKMDEQGTAYVEWREFYGHDQRLGLVLADGTRVVARTGTQAVYETGQRISLSVHAPVQVFAR